MFDISPENIRKNSESHFLRHFQLRSLRATIHRDPQMILTLPFHCQITSILEQNLEYLSIEQAWSHWINSQINYHHIFLDCFKFILTSNISSLSYLIFSIWYALISNRCPFFERPSFLPSSRCLIGTNINSANLISLRRKEGKQPWYKCYHRKNFPVLSGERRRSVRLIPPPPPPFPLCNFICLKTLERRVVDKERGGDRRSRNRHI